MHRFLKIIIFAWLIVGLRGQPSGGDQEEEPQPPTEPSKDPPSGGSPNTTSSTAGLPPSRPTYLIPTRPTWTTTKPRRRACPYGYKWVGYKCTREVYHAVQEPGSINRFLDLGYLVTTSSSMRTKYFTLRPTTRYPDFHPDHPGYYATPPFYYDKEEEIIMRRVERRRSTSSFGKWAINAGTLKSPRYFDRRFPDFQDYEEHRRSYRDYEEQRRPYRGYKRNKSQYRTKKYRSKSQRRG